MAITPLPPAPGADEHVSLSLINSIVTLPSGQQADELGSPEQATRWLISHGLVPEHTSLLAYCQNQLTGLRGHLRSLFAAHVAGTTPPQHALDAVNRTLTKVPSAPLLRYHPTTGLWREPEHPVTQLVEHAMAQVAEDAAGLLTSSTSAQIARCDAPPCNRFLLRTHARRHWCSTRCGDRVRAARSYARRQIGAPAS
ncbi:CGNR zinc finger domain-containing protein [Blastococcus saxobsidens]|uniref:Zinc finger CGNR domain-containing protein n=1 Tax=Blastococcus saxobsidens (strain DD2) TaxID=1146883 RepID=H6RMD8_BLASD|nr:CGNR zinc finger domain-containing protein [Blastococcus saxobsidens]CCG02574.1 conserved protein of unknown function [Blastococcus saxobsidens DD2]